MTSPHLWIAARQAAALPSFLRHPHASREQLSAFQSRRLRQILAHAYRKVPFYRALFDRNGVTPADIRTLQDLGRLPLTSKEDIQGASVEDIVARGIDARRLVLHNTSGSSGQPMMVRRTPGEEWVLGQLRRRVLRYFGLRLTDVSAWVRHVRPPYSNDARGLDRVIRLAGLGRSARIDCRQSPDAIIAALRRLHPDVVGGMPAALALAADHLSDADRQHIRPRFVAVAGEVMTPMMRQGIEQGFRAPVFDTYASTEFNTIAWQCRATGGMHVCDDGVIVEVLADGRPVEPGEEGEVVITGLHSFAMPLVRYRIGDIVIRGSESCPCGQPFSTIRSIQGRIIEYLRLPSGRLLHPTEIISTLRPEYGWIRQYRVLQEREDRIVVELCGREVPGPERLEELRRRISDVVGSDTAVNVSIVPAIPADPDGKFRLCRSLVSPAIHAPVPDPLTPSVQHLSNAPRRHHEPHGGNGKTPN